MRRKNHIVDATNKALGRIASEITLLLRGKHKSDFSPSRDMGDFVTVKNIGKIKFTGKKREQKKYYHHTGYIGSLKEVSLKKLFKRNPAQVLRKAVLGMLPKNRLRARMIKRLKIE